MSRTLLIFAVGISFAGYRDECIRSQDPSCCEGNTLVSCPPLLDPLGPIRWVRSDCGASFCVQVEEGATCALEPTPSARCAGGGVTSAWRPPDQLFARSAPRISSMLLPRYCSYPETPCRARSWERVASLHE
jgi:hypothetical protein